jgi:hypothetical protein
VLFGLLIACSGGPPEPAPAPVPVFAEQAPTVEWRLPAREERSPRPIALSSELAQARTVLEGVVTGHARDPDNPWAIVHGMLALGPSMKLANGADPVDWMFEHYAERTSIGETELVTFPAKVGASLVEPHTDLVLKALTEGGIGPDRAISVRERPQVVGDLYRHSLWRAWAQGPKTGFQEGSYNDAPWALQGLAAWAPEGLAWTASGNRPMTMSGFTTAVIDQLETETRAMSEARAAGQLLQKDTRVGLFRYTCGGQHLVQGAAYAVGRGFGSPADKGRICEQLALLLWRIDVELGAVDPILTAPDTQTPIRIVLLSQRLKFLGHWLETVHKIGALGVCPLGDPEGAATERVATELVRTVDALGALGIWNDVGAVRSNQALESIRGANQVYLDLVGDSSHAVRGIDLATGVGTVRF